MEREGEVGEGRGREKKRRGGGEMRRGILIGGIALSLLMGCNNGLAEELEKKSSFYDSVIKIGHEFQGIFGVFGDAIGNALGFNAVKSDSQKSDVGKHFEKIGEGLKKTKDKLDELAIKIASTVNANVTGVDSIIKSSGEVITKLIESVTKLAGVTKDNKPIGDNASGAAVPSDSGDVNTVIESVKKLIEVAEKSGVDIKPGTPLVQ